MVLLTSFTIPEMERVREDVWETSRNSEASIKKARMPPDNILFVTSGYAP